VKDFRAFLLDLDGVVYRGEIRLPGAQEFVQWADSTGRKVMYLSNNSLATPEDVAERLRRLDMPSPDGRVMTAGWSAMQHIAGRFPGARILVIGLPSVVQLAERAGLHPVWQDNTEGPVPDVVLTALDRSLTYERLKRGLKAILSGATFYSVNRDPKLPVEDGFEPGTGAIAAALEYASGQRAQIVGKPAPDIALQAMDALGARRDETLMVGDGLDLDIVAGHAAGVSTALVLSGLTSAEEAHNAAGERKPDYIFRDMADLLEAARHAMEK